MPDTDEIIEATLAAITAACPDAHEFMPIIDPAGAVQWVQHHNGDRDEAYRIIAWIESVCHHGGELMVAECDHLTCDGAHRPDHWCELPKPADICTYNGTYWQPAEYDTVCLDCAERDEY